MRFTQYEVVYVDKFTDLMKAELARHNLARTFGLQPTHVQRLATGKPVVIKAQVDLEEAHRYKDAVLDAGGVAWIQEVGPDGKHFERRSDQRRAMFDRRTVYRASAIVPDRRQTCGRRSTDRSLRH